MAGTSSRSRVVVAVIRIILNSYDFCWHASRVPFEQRATLCPENYAAWYCLGIT